MKVAHVITGLNDGGAEAALYRLCTHDFCHSHVVISMTGRGKYGPMFEAQGIEVHYMGMGRGRLSTLGLSRLWQLLHTVAPDVIQTWMYHANLVAGLMSKLAGIDRVCWGIHHTHLEEGHSRRSTIMVDRICALLSSRIPRRIVYCAEKAAKVHHELGYVSEKCVVIPNGYDLDLFRPDAEMRMRTRMEFGFGEREVVLGLVGRWNPQKDHANLFQALARLSAEGMQLSCLLVGPDMTTNNTELLDLLQRFGLQDRTTLAGQRGDIPAIMNALDVHVLSSFGEAFPNVVSEAMACGTPCVVTDVGDAPVIVNNPEWVAPPRDAAALAQAIRSVLAVTEKQGRGLVAMHCRKRIMDNFSIQRMIDSYRQVWSDVAHGWEKRVP